MFESDQIVSAVRWLGQFRLRLILAACIPVIGAMSVLCISDWLIAIISDPLAGQPLYFLSPVEGFTAKLKLAVFGGIALAVPLEAYMAASMFTGKLSRDLLAKVRVVFIPCGTVCFAGGILFAYKLLLPATVGFLLSSGGEFMQPMIAGAQYVSFVAFFLLACGLVFELPLVLVGLSRIGLVTSKMLQRKRRVAILISFIAMAALTPSPDAFTLMASTVPVILLYEISIWWIRALEKAGLETYGHK